jgi:hypothetical protein
MLTRYPSLSMMEHCVTEGHWFPAPLTLPGPVLVGCTLLCGGRVTTPGRMLLNEEKGDVGDGLMRLREQA